MARKTALLSLSDKSKLKELVAALDRHGWDIVSSGGTAQAVESHGGSCTSVEKVTGFPAILGGRVKTLHPKIFGGILSSDNDRDLQQRDEYEIPLFDLIIVDLYPFAQAPTREAGDAVANQAVELIDIGGVALIRAAAKNFQRCAVVPGAAYIPELIAALDAHTGELPELAVRQRWAARAFDVCACYDGAIASYLGRDEAADRPEHEERMDVRCELAQPLAYGENPHQQGALYRIAGEPQLPFSQIAGKELSYNNFIDLDGALGLIGEFSDDIACAIIKHSNPCGVGLGSSQLEAYERALSADEVSAFGGIVAFNRPLDVETAEQLRGRFLEIVVAPQITEGARKQLSTKKKLRLLEYNLDALQSRSSQPTFRKTLCGVLTQSSDHPMQPLDHATVVSAKQPNPEQMRGLWLAWRVCKWVKSNAIVIGADQQTLGIGAGQMSRVDAVELAIRKAQTVVDGDLRARQPLLASDAFFPFRDSIDRAHEAGISAIVQPGGSIRDQEVIDAADEHGMVLIMTGRRHFRH